MLHPLSACVGHIAVQKGILSVIKCRQLTEYIALPVNNSYHILEIIINLVVGCMCMKHHSYILSIHFFFPKMKIGNLYRAVEKIVQIRCMVSISFQLL